MTDHPLVNPRSKLPCDPWQIDHFLSEPSTGTVEAAGLMAGPVGVLGAGGKMGLYVSAMLRKSLDRAGRTGVPVYAACPGRQPEAF